MIEKIITFLTMWILLVVAIIMTVGIFKFANINSAAKIDCTTYNFNPDSTKDQKSICRSLR